MTKQRTNQPGSMHAEASATETPTQPAWRSRTDVFVRRLACVITVVGLFLFAATPARAANWAERLGYPSGSRVVILYATELGMCYETSTVTQDALAKGHLHSAGAMVPCPWFAECATWYRDHKSLDVGLAVTTTSELPGYRWRPVSPRNRVPGLVDRDGFLCRTAIQGAINGTPAEIEREIRAQIQAARAAGLRPSHMTSHLGSVFAHDDFAAAYLKVAREMWIPALVVELTPEHVARFHAQGFPLDQRMIDLIANYPLPKLDDLRFTPPAESYEEKRDRFMEMVAGLAPGLTQISFHPAEDSPALRRLTRQWQDSLWDAQLLADPQVHAFFKEQKIVFTSWREIMIRFHGDTARGKSDEDTPATDPASDPPEPPQLQSDDAASSPQSTGSVE